MQQQPNHYDAMARLQLDIDSGVKQRLKLQSVREDRTMSEIVEAALVEYLARVEKGGK